MKFGAQIKVVDERTNGEERGRRRKKVELTLPDTSLRTLENRGWSEYHSLRNSIMSAYAWRE
jgi:hypothetical protein